MRLQTMRLSTISMLALAVLGNLVCAQEEAAPEAANKAQMPPEAVRVLAYYVGSWSVEGTVGDKPLKGTGRFDMPEGQYCVIGSVSFAVDGQTERFSIVSGWDSSTGWLTEQGVGSDGGVYSLRWKNVSAAVDEGELVGTVGGKQFTEKDRVERKGDGEFVVTCTERKLGDEVLPDWTLVYRKMAAEKVKPVRAKAQREVNK